MKLSAIGIIICILQVEAVLSKFQCFNNEPLKLRLNMFILRCYPNSNNALIFLIDSPETEKIDQFGSQDCKCFDINSTCKDLCPKLGFPKGQMSEIKEFTDSLPCSDVPQYCACIKCKNL